MRPIDGRLVARATARSWVCSDEKGVCIAYTLHVVQNDERLWQLIREVSKLRRNTDCGQINQ